MTRVTDQELSAAQRYLEEMEKWIGWLSDPDSVQSQPYSSRQRDMMRRSYEARAKRARTNLEALRARRERELLEPEDPTT